VGFSVLSSARDKFVAFAFCWADALIEVDQSRRILFAVGATKALTGAKPEELIGKDLNALIDPKDRVLTDQLLAMTSKRGRIHNVVIHFTSPDGAKHPVSFAGYVMPDLKDHHFLAFRSTVALNENADAEGVERDKETGLLSSASFSEVAVQQLKDSAAAGKPAEMTLVNLPGFEKFFDSLSEDERAVFKNTIGTTLRANSIDGNSAGEMGGGKFGVIHAAGLDVAALEKTIAQATQAFDPAGKGIDVQAGTVQVDTSDISEEDLAKGLAYTINHFKEQVGEKFNVKDITQNMNGLVQEAVQSQNNYSRMLTRNN
jgi:PAS domain S-box-containing protein